MNLLKRRSICHKEGHLWGAEQVIKYKHFVVIEKKVCDRCGHHQNFDNPEDVFKKLQAITADFFIPRILEAIEKAMKETRIKHGVNELFMEQWRDDEEKTTEEADGK